MAVILFILAVLAFLALYYLYQPSAGQQSKGTGLNRREIKFFETSIYEALGLSADQCKTFVSFIDRFANYSEVAEAVKQAGLEKSDIIVGIDFSASNEWQGRKTYNSKCLHDVSNKCFNPYQRVLSIMGATLEQFDSDHLIPVYGFGDKLTKSDGVFSLKEHDKPCYGFVDVLESYSKICTQVTMSGPTSLAPVIMKAIEIVKLKWSYHILLVITDGQLKNDSTSVDAIVLASNYPISIIVVGVGDGPWDNMENYDDNLPMRKFDNFQFVNFHQVCQKAKYAEAGFALNALMEIPDQYKAICSLGYLKQNPTKKEL